MYQQIYHTALSKALQYTASVAGGLVLAIEGTVDYLAPCLVAIVVDVYTAWGLGKRVALKHPDRADGKFKSEYKWRILQTLLVIFVALLLAHLVDQILGGEAWAVRFTSGAFLFYQVWSILENWSSERPESNRLARYLQRVMINKAERHMGVDLSDILRTDAPTQTDEDRTDEPQDRPQD